MTKNMDIIQIMKPINEFCGRTMYPLYSGFEWDTIITHKKHFLSFRSRISGIIQITLFGYFDNSKEVQICIQDQSMMTILKIIWSHNINTMLPDYAFGNQ